MQEATRETSADRLTAIRTRMAAAAKLARRPAEDIHLIAVSKTRSAQDIEPLILEGQRLFGENRVQEAASKWPALKAQHPEVELHLIGQLQSNKAEEAVALFDVIHSVDRLSLVTALGKAMEKLGRAVPCFLQVNIGAEEQKGGCSVADLPDLLKAAQDAGLPVAGLMCIPPAELEAAPFFALLAELSARHGLMQLSMGMSDDFETAIMLGATYVRVGTALFGKRPSFV
ncbi:YggS family pyridoxal phosphate-dependent enzyme [Sphingorhabdus wooponensis]|uniref:Pyridoxal phosphate homeostasis protein n=1 Tax=Sphingorhabdus wooponensis TaxID=940136 RepID=A0A426RPP6_9SPHN|nr:YggS family pyridoxal phosphate-dependent enzyme [Sphingorhabdus wooponensis]RRQ50941.1 YggS family pyridoxal phosphate-dependent enzyme [Sphingorhabdus wooponensis]